MGLLMDYGGPWRASLVAMDWGWDLVMICGDARNELGVIFFHLTRVLEASGLGDGYYCGNGLAGRGNSSMLWLCSVVEWITGRDYLRD